MKQDAIFINTSRGGVHNEDLLQALRSRKIWGAGLDVTNPEPMKPDNPLRFADRCHIAAYRICSTEAVKGWRA